MENIENVVEAIIFASGSAILKSDICEKVPELTTQKLNSIIKSLQKRYSENCGIVLLEFNGKVQFSSNPKYGDTVADVLTPLREKELTKTLLEVLATIAYKQPITRLEIDEMRSNKNSEYALTGLLKAGLIEAVGRKETVGRPLLYGTTDEFLKKFQISGIDELPDYDEVLEKLMLINAPSQETLFHNRTIWTRTTWTTKRLPVWRQPPTSTRKRKKSPNFWKASNLKCSTDVLLSSYYIHLQKLNGLSVLFLCFFHKKRHVTQNSDMAIAYCAICVEIIAIMLLLPIRFVATAHFALSNEILKAQVKFLGASLMRVKVVISNGIRVEINGKIVQRQRGISSNAIRNLVKFLIENKIVDIKGLIAYVGAYDAKDGAILCAVIKMLPMISKTIVQDASRDRFDAECGINIKINALQIAKAIATAKGE